MLCNGNVQGGQYKEECPPYVSSYTVDKKSFNAKLKIFKNRKNWQLPTPKPREGKPEFFRFFKIFNFPLKDFLIQVSSVTTKQYTYKPDGR